MITILISAIAIGLSTLALNDAFISAGRSQSSNAIQYAEAGAKDALVRIARNKNYVCDTPSAGCYSIEFVANGCSANDGCARITVSSGTSPKTIVSTGQVKDNIRRIQVDAYLDGNGEITSVNWQELTD
ncbi:MAG: hypothetical protein AAB686_01820 [Patescibacteria group bacterium]